MNKVHYPHIPSPCYVLEESLLRRNLSLIRSVAERSGVEIILAFKAYALWKTFPIFREYITASTASSVYEARLGFEEMGSPVHTFSPGYTQDNFAEIQSLSSHITFNSLSQLESMRPFMGRGEAVSYGLRINPEYSVVETDLYNPCAPGSRFGVTASELGDHLPAGVEGLHFHALCEGNSYNLEEALAIIERNFSKPLAEAKWINCGGGHLMTRKDYDTEHLISVLKAFKARHPHLHVILEPGSAFAWQTGFLKATVIDLVCHHGIHTAIVDVSFTCHMPDCLEMPYQPAVRGAESVEQPVEGKYCYRIGGNSCLSGDFIGYWAFDTALTIGDEIIFEDMIHYTTVKTNMFNGIPHPQIALLGANGDLDIMRTYSYEDYKNRMN